WNLHGRSGAIRPDASFRHGQVLIESFETRRIVPIQLGGSIIDVVAVVGLYVPRIAIGTLRPEEIPGTGVGAAGIVGNNGAVNGIRIPWGHVLIDTVGIRHDEIVQHVLRSSRTRE